ncbi:MAG: transglutaminase-like domain-containing protein [Bifidobacteriaceae bacterium]|nr:transglutaminase-like domain-containing protein [Bifidobacteriaceae bacterium]
MVESTPELPENFPTGTNPPSANGPYGAGAYPPFPDQQTYPPAYPTGQPQGYPAGQPQGYPPGYPPAQPQGYPPPGPQSYPAGYPPAPPQGYPAGRPQGPPQGYPPSYSQAQPQGYPPGPPAGKPKSGSKRPGRKRAWPKVLIAAGVAAVLATGGIVYLKVWRPNPTAGPSASPAGAEDQLIDPAYLEGLPYDFDEPKVIKPTDEFEIKFDKDVDVDTLADQIFEEKFRVEGDPLLDSRGPMDYRGLVEIYLDPQLTTVARADFFGGLYGDTLSLSPLPVIAYQASTALGDSFQVSEEPTWQESDVLWVAQYYDKAGAELDRPRVTPLIVDREGLPMASPVESFNYSLAANGGIDFSWAPVEGADGYLVMVRKDGVRTVRDDKMGEPNPEPMYTVAALSTTTHANTVDDATEDSALSAFGLDQNEVFWIAPISEDDIAQNRSMVDGEYAGMVDYTDDFDLAYNAKQMVGIVAYGKGDSVLSVPRWQRLDALWSQLPMALTWQAWQEHRQACKDLPTFSEQAVCFSTLPVTMADGHTAMAPARFAVDTARVEPSGAIVDSVKINFDALRVEVKLAQGVITDEVSFRDPPADWERQLQEAAALAARAGPPAGLAASFSYAETDWEELLKNAKEPSSELPDVPYPVSGSSDYVKFVAANLMAGNFVLDITKFDDGRVGTPTFQDVVEEAVAQNPYIIGNRGDGRVVKEGNRTLGYAYVEHDPDAEMRQEKQQAIADQVAEAIDEVITDGMSDRDKAMALNKWLAGHAKYDYDALALIEETDDLVASLALFVDYPNNQNAYGVLVEGKGVCASYAQGYKALADAAGLQAVVVTGVVLDSGSRHAWNKVFMDGKWQAVDPTWNDDPNDSGEELSKYFGVTDDSLGRTLDNDWLVDSKIAEHAAV